METGSTVVAKVYFCEIPTLIVIVDTSEETGCCPALTGTVDGRSHHATVIIESRSKVYFRQSGDNDTIALQAKLGLAHHFRLETDHCFEVMPRLQIVAVFCIGIQVHIVLLVKFFMHIRSCAVDYRIAVHIMVEGLLRVPVTVGRHNAVVEVDMGNPVLDRFEDQRSLLVDIIGLRIIASAGSQSQCG